MNVNSDEEMLRFRTNQTKEIGSFQQEKKVNKLLRECLKFCVCPKFIT